MQVGLGAVVSPIGTVEPAFTARSCSLHCPLNPAGSKRYTARMPKLFGWLPKRRWLRWMILAAGSGFLFLVVLAVTIYILLQQPAMQARVMSYMFTAQLQNQPPDPPEPSLGAADLTRLAGHIHTVNSAGDLLAPTNIWNVRFHFTADQWHELGPNRIPVMPGFTDAEGRIRLDNPEATRPGLAGVLGLDFPWSQAAVDIGGRALTNVAIRYKGNGTFLSGMGSYKRPLKIDLNKNVKGQKLAGRSKFNFANLLAENSLLTDTLGYEFYREAGVPAIRTAFARVLLTIGGRFTNRVTGLYLLTEDPDADWAEKAFSAEGAAVFKPVTSELLKYLGKDWSAYERPYNAKTDVAPAQQQRLIALARLCTEAEDAEFNREIGGFIDLKAFATWLACETTLANYDGLYTTGQNFLLYLDPRTDRFSFGPWDLDHSWGEFPFVGTAETRERASIWHPWTGENRFLERMFAHEEFRALYRGELERLQQTLFQPERLGKRLDELAALIRPFVAEESTNRLARFEASVADTWVDGPRDGDPMDPNRPVFPIKRFFEARAKSVRAQLAGEETGVELSGMLPP